MVDPYDWLAIDKQHRPPTHYQLLGIASWVNDEAAILAAVERQLRQLDQHVDGPHAATVERVRSEIGEARDTLLDSERRRLYDILAPDPDGDDAPATTAQVSIATQPVGDVGDVGDVEHTNGAVQPSEAEVKTWWNKSLPDAANKSELWWQASPPPEEASAPPPLWWKHGSDVEKLDAPPAYHPPAVPPPAPKPVIDPIRGDGKAIPKFTIVIAVVIVVAGSGIFLARKVANQPERNSVVTDSSTGSNWSKEGVSPAIGKKNEPSVLPGAPAPPCPNPRCN